MIIGRNLLKIEISN